MGPRRSSFVVSLESGIIRIAETDLDRSKLTDELESSKRFGPTKNVNESRNPESNNGVVSARRDLCFSSSNNSSSSSSSSSSASSASSGRVGLRCRRPLLRRLRNWRRRGRRKSQGSMSDRFLEARIMHVALCIMRSIGL
uniref:Uncharacterized protein n=1 Tax=Vespula pensylvanica TaxID=30213 RepID=A0A834PBR2_VESPE|nr:hypothetical protein H0235_003337 [Vespula pensylvanica]